MRIRLRPVLLLASLMVAALLVPAVAHAEDVDGSEIFFPVQVQDSLHYADHWGDARSGGRRHLGVDIMSDQMTSVFASQSGTIYDWQGECSTGEHCSSYYLLLDGDDGRMYFFVHMNNDTPGRPNGCDGTGGAENAFAPRLVDAMRKGQLKGLRVERGEHLGWVGSSGNAGCRVDHLHFEIWEGEGWTGHGEGVGSINPYPPTRAAQDAGNVWGASWTPGTPAPSSRVAGADRIDTAVALSKKAFRDGAETVVIAPATYYQEALVASPLAATVDGPVLLAWPNGSPQQGAISDTVAAEIDRLGADHAIVVGAARRIGNDVVDELVAKTGLRADDIRRVGDADPGVLSAEVAEVILAAQGVDVPAGTDGRRSTQVRQVLQLPPLERQVASREAAAANGDAPAPVDPLLAAGVHPSGLGWPDALAASVLGSRQLAPVLLTPSDDLHPQVARILSADGVRTARIVGGRHAVDAGVQTEVERRTGRAARRLAGEDRYATSQAVQAEIQRDGASMRTLSVATGQDFPDALTAGPALARLDRSFVLVHGSLVHEGVQSWIRGNARAIERLEVIGGPNAVVETVLREAALAANSES